MKKILMGLFALLYIFTACANSKTLTNYELDFVRAFTDFAKEHDENFLLDDRRTDEEMKVSEKQREIDLMNEYDVTSQVSYDMYDNDGNYSFTIIIIEHKKTQKNVNLVPTGCIVEKTDITLFDYEDLEYGDEVLKLFEDVCNDIGGEFSEYEPYDPDK